MSKHLGTILLNNLRTKLKLGYNIKSLNYIQQTFSVQALFLHCILLSYVFYLFDMISGLKLIKIRNDCVTLRNGLSETIIAINVKWLYMKL